MNKQIFTLLIGIGSSISIGLIVFFSKLLRGDGEIPYPSEEPKELKDFKQSHKSIRQEDLDKFLQAYQAQQNKDNSRAKRLYSELLSIYPNNKVIEYNLKLIDASK